MHGRLKRLGIALVAAGGLLCGICLEGCGFSIQTKNFTDFSIRSFNGRSFGSRAVSETIQKTYAATRVRTLRLHDELGAIEVRPIEDDRDEIRIEATKTAEGRRLSKAELRELLTKVKITACLDGDTLVIDTGYDPTEFPEAAKATVSFVLSVPQRLALDLRSYASPVSTIGPGSDVTMLTSGKILQ